MLSKTPITGPARIAISALLILGLLGGSLVVAHAGFETSPRRGGTPVFVPLPEAYIMAACMYGMSFLAMLALVRDRSTSNAVSLVASAVYVAVAYALIQSIGPI